MELDGKVAIVTGAAGGLGLVYAAALAEEGASVAITDIDGDAVFTPDGAWVQLGNRDTHDVPSNAFVSVTGIVERGLWDYRLKGKVEIKILYGAKSPPASPSK